MYMATDSNFTIERMSERAMRVAVSGGGGGRRGRRARRQQRRTMARERRHTQRCEAVGAHTHAEASVEYVSQVTELALFGSQNDACCAIDAVLPAVH